MTDSEFIEGKEVGHGDSWKKTYSLLKKVKGLAMGEKM